MRRKHKDWWAKFWSADNSQVNTPMVVGLAISIPVACLSFAALIFDIFWQKKGLTGSAVQLLLGLLGVTNTVMGASLFSKTTMFSQITSRFGNAPDPPQEPPRPRVKPKGGGDVANP